MSSNRLTEYSRARILERVLTHRFQAQRDAVEKRKLELGLKFYNDLYPKDIQKKMAALPSDFFDTNAHAHVVFGEESGTHKHVEFDKERQTSYYGRRRVQKVYPLQHPLVVEYEQYEAADQQLNADTNALHREVYAVLRSVTTDKKLLQVWPEVAPFLRAADEPEPASLPAVQIVDLNLRLGLPVEA